MTTFGEISKMKRINAFNIEINHVYNIHCMKGLPVFKDNEIDLIVTDPPYGLNIAKTGCLSIKGVSNKRREFKASDWDKKIPDKKHFNEMIRVSKNQIIFGGNYFTQHLSPSKCWLIWYKKEGLPAKYFADCELIWTSFNKPSRVFSSRWHGFIRDSKEERQPHLTQKPLDLMKWIIENYSNEDDLILDPYAGSGSTLEACKILNRKYIGFEINNDYYNICLKRLNRL